MKDFLIPKLLDLSIIENELPDVSYGSGALDVSINITWNKTTLTTGSVVSSEMSVPLMNQVRSALLSPRHWRVKADPGGTTMELPDGFTSVTGTATVRT